MALHIEGDELIFSEVRWNIRLYRQQIFFMMLIFRWTFPPSTPRAFQPVKIIG